MKKILLDEQNDLKISVKRDSEGKITEGITLGDTQMQDAYIALSSLKGEIKADPIAGCNLFRLVRGKSTTPPRKEIKLALKRVGISFDDIKDKLNIK